MKYGDIVAIGVLDVRHLNQPGKIVIQTPAAAPSQLISIGDTTTAPLLRVPGAVSTRNIAIGNGALAASDPALFASDIVAIGDGALGATANLFGAVALGNDAGALGTNVGGVYVGYQAALNPNTSNSTVVGTQAAFQMAAVVDNVIVGEFALYEATGNTEKSVVIGSEAAGGAAASAPRDAIYIGQQAAFLVGAATGSVVIGTRAATGGAFSDNCVVVGSYAATAGAFSRDQVVVGAFAAPAMVAGGAGNTVIGHGAADALTTGASNVIIGRRERSGTAPAGPTTSSLNVVIGPWNSLGGAVLAEIPAGGTGSYIVIAGGTSIVVVDPALSSVHIGSSKPGNWRTATGTGSISIGAAAADALTTGLRNIAIGVNALGVATTGDDNVAIGNSALLGNAGSEDVNRNVAIGAFALDDATAGVTDNVAIGYSAGTAVTSAIEGVYVGRSAGLGVTTGSGGVHVGRGAGSNTTTGPYNILIGYAVAPTLTIGDHNIVIGAVEDTSTLADVSAAGATGQIILAAEQTVEGPAFRQSLVVVALSSVYIGSNKPGNWLTSTGQENVGVGHTALGVLTLGTGNVALGPNALDHLTTGDFNVGIGKDAGNVLTTGARNIVVGNDTDTPANNSNDVLNIGKAIFGNLATGNIRLGDVQTVAVGAQTERLAITTTEPDTVAPFSIATTGANGAKIFSFSGTRDPNGLVTGDPGDVYHQKSGALSTTWINTGAAAANTVWTSLRDSAFVTQAAIPIETDDDADGYRVGDRIYAIDADAVYTCLSNTTGAAVWRRDSEDNGGYQVVLSGPRVANNIDTFSLDGWANDGTIDIPVQTNASLRESLRRINVGATPIGVHLRGGLAGGGRVFWRGDATGRGGFYLDFTVAIVSAVAGQRSIFGILENSAGSGFDPDTQTNAFFIGNRAADGNLQAMVNDNAGTVTAVDLGANFPADEGIYQIILYARPHDGAATALRWVVRRLDVAAVAAGSATVNTPQLAVFMLPFLGLAEVNGNNLSFDLMHFYARTPG